MTTPALSTRKLKLRVFGPDDQTSLKKSLHLSDTINVAFEAAAEAERAMRNVKVACRNGCDTCCTHDMPPLVEYEAQALVWLLLDDPQLADVQERIRRTLAIALSEWRITGPGPLPVGLVPCPFLGDDHACRIYEHRPAACRIAYSEDASWCASAAAMGEQPWMPDLEEIVTAIQRVEMEPAARRFIEKQYETAQRVPLFVALALLLWPETKQLILNASLAAQKSSIQ